MKSFLNNFLVLQTSISKKNYLHDIISYFMHEVASGLSYMHSIGIIHRDIKGQNVLLQIDGSIKLCDLGIAKKAKKLKSSKHQFSTLIGTPHFMAPEVIDIVKKPKQKYGFESDIWSLGALMYELSTGAPRISR